MYDSTLFKDTPALAINVHIPLTNLCFGFYEVSELEMPPLLTRNFFGLCLNLSPHKFSGPAEPIASQHFNLISLSKQGYNPTDTGLSLFTIECEPGYWEEIATMYPLFTELLHRSGGTDQMKAEHEAIPELVLVLIQELFESVKDDLASGIYSEEKKGALEAKLVQIVTLSLDTLDSPVQRRKSGQGRIREAYRYVMEHFAEPITLPDVTRIAGINKDVLNKVFKKNFGSTVHQIIRQVRLNRAKVLLRDTDLPLHSIAKLTGYKNVSTFTRDFRMKFGYAPD